jgi:stearoyl-CoA desaturase (Delta-9 desaturase)
MSNSAVVDHSRDPDRKLQLVKSVPFFTIHALAVIGVVLLGWSWSGFALAIGLYYLRMFGVTAGYHRYFSHRTFKTSRVMQFLLAWLAMSSSQKGVLWWASHHRHHHKHSDEPVDVHSVLQDGFFWSHVGWILSSKWEATDESKVKDLTKFPELRWLDRWFLLPPTVLGVGLFLIGGWWALVWGLFVSTTLLWHGTFTINSLTHMWGNRRYKTTDNSRNSFILAIVTMGEGWHNNHHYYQGSVNQGFFWWELDVTYRVRVEETAAGEQTTDVTKVIAGAEHAFGVPAYEALLQKTVPQVDRNDGMIDAEPVVVEMANKQMAATRTEYKVMINGKPATMSVFENKALGDMGGEIATADGKLIYRARIVEMGSAPIGTASR